MHIVIYQGDSNNNVLPRMAASLQQGLVRCGVRASLYAPKVRDGRLGAFRRLAEMGADAVVSFGSGGGDWTTDDGQSVYDALGCSFVGWDVDHPSYSIERLITPVARRLQICASTAHLRFARALGGSGVGLLMLPGADAPAGEPTPIAERPIHALAALSWIGEPHAWWREAEATPAQALLETAVERALADPEVDLLAAFQAAQLDTGVSLPLTPESCQIVSRIGLFVRQYDRCRLAEALADANMPRVLCGVGWRERLGERPHLVYEERLDYRALAERYGAARVVININAANGASERVSVALAAGAVVVSDYSPLLQSAFEAQGALSFYDRRRPASVIEVIASLAEDGRAQTLADQGRAVVKQHSWTAKAATFLEALQAMT